MKPLVAWALLCGASVSSSGGDEPLKAAFLIEDGVYNTELTAPLDILHHTPFHARPGVTVFTVAGTREPVTTFEGLRIVPDHDYRTAPEIDILVVPSAERHVRADFDDPELIRFVRERAEGARYVMSLCDGAFVLARAGLLDGRFCTTFPADIPALRERFPEAHVVEGVSFVHDGKFITSNGGARSFEPALYVVELLHGRRAAEGVARGLVIDWELEAVPHYVHDPRRRGLRPGDRLPASVTVDRADGRPVDLLSLLGDEDRVLVVSVLGGGAPRADAPRAGMWCEDSLNDIPVLRHAAARFASEPVRFVRVVCPPIQHEQRFGFPSGGFMGDGPDHLAAVRLMVKSTEACVASGVLPSGVYYDFRYRLLRDLSAHPRRDDDPEWVGCLRAPGEMQIYGTPTIWLFDREGTVLSPPFFGNNYERDVPLRYTSRELEEAIRAALARTSD